MNTFNDEVVRERVKRLRLCVVMKVFDGQPESGGDYIKHLVM